MAQQKPSFEEKTRFLFMLCTFFLHEPIGFVLSTLTEILVQFELHATVLIGIST